MSGFSNYGDQILLTVDLLGDKPTQWQSSSMSKAPGRFCGASICSICYIHRRTLYCTLHRLLHGAECFQIHNETPRSRPYAKPTAMQPRLGKDPGDYLRKLLGTLRDIFSRQFLHADLKQQIGHLLHAGRDRSKVAVVGSWQLKRRTVQKWVAEGLALIQICLSNAMGEFSHTCKVLCPLRHTNCATRIKDVKRM